MGSSKSIKTAEIADKRPTDAARLAAEVLSVIPFLLRMILSAITEQIKSPAMISKKLTTYRAFEVICFDRSVNLSIIFLLLSSGLYRWYRSFTDSALIGFADCTASRDFHPALKLTNELYYKAGYIAIEPK